MTMDEMIQGLPDEVMAKVGRTWCRKQRADQEYAEAMKEASDEASKLELLKSINQGE